MTKGRSPTYAIPSSLSPANLRPSARPQGTEPTFSSCWATPCWFKLASQAGWPLETSPTCFGPRPDLDRLYARLEDEYELSERAETLNRKLAVIADTATTLADIIDTKRTLRLEIIIVILIAFEIVITFYEIYARKG